VALPGRAGDTACNTRSFDFEGGLASDSALSAQDDRALKMDGVLKMTGCTDDRVVRIIAAPFRVRKMISALPYLHSDCKWAAALSGVISRCGMSSISNPTINFRIVAERNSGG
jgi:hypothetical protein